MKYPKRKTGKSRSALIEGSDEWEACLIIVGAIAACAVIAVGIMLIFGSSLSSVGLLGAAIGGFLCGYVFSG